MVAAVTADQAHAVVVLVREHPPAVHLLLIDPAVAMERLADEGWGPSACSRTARSHSTYESMETPGEAEHRHQELAALVEHLPKLFGRRRYVQVSGCGRHLVALALRGFVHLAFGPTQVHGIGEAGETGEIVVILHGSDALRGANKLITAVMKIPCGFLQSSSALVQ